MTATHEGSASGLTPPAQPNLPSIIETQLNHLYPKFIDSTIDDMRSNGLSWQHRYPQGASHDTLKRYAAPDLALKLSYQAMLLRGQLPAYPRRITSAQFNPSELLDGFQAYNNLLVQGHYASSIWKDYIPPYIEASRGRQIESNFLSILRARARQRVSPFGTEGKRVTFEREIYPTILAVHGIAHAWRREAIKIPQPRRGQ